MEGCNISAKARLAFGLCYLIFLVFFGFFCLWFLSCEVSQSQL